MNKSKVSILIPCYNAEKWIAETIKSALDQTWKDKEVIIIDDGSTDHSLLISKQFESANVKVISQENQGASVARNRALIEAQGDLIQYLDADDLLAPDKIELQINLLHQGYTDYVISGEWGRFYNSPLETKFTKEIVWQDLSPVDCLVYFLRREGMMPLHSWLIPRHIAEKAGSWNEELSLNDDGEYFCRVILASQGIKFCAGAKSYYRSGIDGSLSSLKSHSALKSAFLAVQLCTDSLLARENSDRTRYACACYWQSFVFMAYPQVPQLIRYAEQHISDLGGCDLKPSGGDMFKFICEILGWKVAIHLQRLYYRYRYQIHM